MKGAEQGWAEAIDKIGKRVALTKGPDGAGTIAQDFVAKLIAL